MVPCVSQHVALRALRSLFLGTFVHQQHLAHGTRTFSFHASKTLLYMATWTSTVAW